MTKNCFDSPLTKRSPFRSDGFPDRPLVESNVMRERAYRRYLLCMLMITLGFNSMDRMALGLLLQSIKVDLKLTDTQLGMLTGIAFALFYSLMGMPIARWADRGNRVTIIATVTALWSVAVAA